MKVKTNKEMEKVMEKFMADIEKSAENHGVSYALAALVPFKNTDEEADEGNLGNSAMKLHSDLTQEQNMHLLAALDEAVQEIADQVGKKAKKLPLRMLAELLKEHADDDE